MSLVKTCFFMVFGLPGFRKDAQRVSSFFNFFNPSNLLTVQADEFEDDKSGWTNLPWPPPSVILCLPLHVIVIQMSNEKGFCCEGVPHHKKQQWHQWIILVLVIGGRDYITPQKAIHTWYTSGICCQLDDYILTTILYKNLKNSLKWHAWTKTTRIGGIFISLAIQHSWVVVRSWNCQAGLGISWSILHHL